MTRLELLTIVVGRARANGFEFRRWYTGRLGLPWISAEASLKLLDQQRRYYALLFSHEFANAFWKAGEEITFAAAKKIVAAAKKKPWSRPGLSCLLGLGPYQYRATNGPPNL